MAESTAVRRSLPAASNRRLRSTRWSVASYVRRYRSFIDVAAGVARESLVTSDALSDALRTRRYAKRVFISPPWEELFHPDAERRHTFLEAVAEYESLVPAYRRLGYEIVFLPRGSEIGRAHV